MSASVSSAMMPRVEEETDSSEDEVVWKGRWRGSAASAAQRPVDRLPDPHASEDEVVWKGRLKVSTTSCTQCPADRPPDPQQRQSEATTKRRVAPLYYAQPTYYNSYPPYPQPIWPYPPAYPLVYPQAYPRFYASPYVLPYTAPTSRAPNHHVQRVSGRKYLSNAVHSYGRSGLKTPEHLRESKTKAKKPGKVMSITPSVKRKVRSRAGLEKHKKALLAVPDPGISIDKAYACKGSSKAQPTLQSHSAERAVSSSPVHSEKALSCIPDVAEHRPSIEEQTAGPSSLLQHNIVHRREPAVNHSGPRGYSSYPKPIRRTYSEPSLSAQRPAHFVLPYYVSPKSVTTHPLHIGLDKPSDHEVDPNPINPEYVNGEKTPQKAAKDILSAAGDVSISRPLSQQTPKPNFVDERNAKRVRHLKPDGLVTSVTIQSSHAALHSQFSIASQMKWPDRMTTDEGMRMEVKKAVSAKRLRRRDGAYSMELYCDEGPSSHKKDGDYQIRWLHMQTSRLNLADFENACLNAPGLGGEARFVLLKLFKQIQVKHRKQLFDGYSIEPGTVLRCDGHVPGDSDAMQPSATFICFPYLSVDMRQQATNSSGLGYPTRSILQTLYPYESTTFREEAPSFCSDSPRAADRVLCVPQCWIVILNSGTLLSCAELDSGEMMNPAVSLSHSKKYFPPVIGHQDQNFPRASHTTKKGSAVGTLDSMSSPQVSAQLRTETDAYNRNFEQLFKGIRVEDYLVEDDGSDASSMASTSECSLDSVEVATLPGTRDGIVQQERAIAESSNDGGCHLAVHDAFEELNASKTLPSTLESPCSGIDLERTRVAGSLHDLHESQLEHPSLTVEKATKEEASMLAHLHSLESPQMTTEYLAKFKTYISFILGLWDGAPPEARRRQLEILTRLQEGLVRAELLRSMCDLELQDRVFSENIEYRDAMLVALGIENSSFQKELECLGEVVRDAMTLFNGIPDSNTTAAIKSAKETLQRQGKAAKPVSSGALQSPELTSGLACDSVKPFLTWISIDAELDEKDNGEQVTAEYLHTIMGEIEKSLSLRNEESYEFARELAISDLEFSLAAPAPQPSAMTSNIVAPSPQRASSRQGSLISTPQILPSLGTVLENLPPEDALIRAQKSEVRTAIDDLFTCLKRFVGLYVACTYSHRVCHKIWGSMARLNNTATRLFQEGEHGKLLYIVRPLEPAFLRTHRIKKPTMPIESCPACRDGQVYKSHQDTMNHLNIVHYGDSSLLRSSRYQQTVRRYFVRTENDVRNERANKQQLELLQICIRYLEHLVTRGEKLHSGFTDGEQTDRRRYQLPDGLVDCFEETALFFMQATTSIVAIRNETGSWKHVPGKAIDDLETPAVQSALEKLGKLGESAKASMTKAEKAIALAGIEESMVGMGSAGPELLVSILLQNMGKKYLLDDVKMDVNQLYQENTSKLQYQINQFPRKRLLRTLHKLQEELTVVQLVNSWQQKTLTSLLQVLDPQTFEMPTHDRINLYPPESECITDSLVSLRAKATELEALENRTQYLREQLKQSVEILEEDHGKAILVFTMVTTIFLPLSFITSFFGMNMSDIRNTSSTQASFWAIAIPVTAGIVFAAVLLAYRGDKMYDAVVEAVHDVREQQRRRNVRTAPLQDGRKWRDFLAFTPPSLDKSKWRDLLSCIPPSWALRKRGDVTVQSVEMETLESSHNGPSAVVP